MPLVEYSFNERKEYRKEFPINSIRLEYMYDINKLGQQYMYTSKDNVLLSIRRQKDTRATYLRQAELTYSYEQYNGLAYNAIVRNRREYATEYAVFDRINADGTISDVKHYNMTELELKLRYGKNEKFYQTRNSRVPITFDALIFNFSHVMAKKNLLGSSYDYHRTGYRHTETFLVFSFWIYRHYHQSRKGMEQSSVSAVNSAECKPFLYHSAGSLYEYERHGVYQ